MQAGDRLWAKTMVMFHRYICISNLKLDRLVQLLYVKKISQKTRNRKQETCDERQTQSVKTIDKNRNSMVKKKLKHTISSLL